MFKRKCQTMYMALLAVLLWIPSTSWALGLGDIEVDSALNEKFSATIELLDAGGLRPSEIIVSMASREDFDRVGVERFFFLTTLAFEVRNEGGRPKVFVTSSQPIAEPYIDFIVELRWPNGRLLKEFTVLLDPPTFTETVAAPVTAPSQGSGQVASSEPQSSSPTPRVTRQPTRVNVPSRPSRSARPVATGDGLMTTRDDTLWTIAERTLPSDRVTMNQQMLAIQRLNRNAFIRDNINLLKAGYELELPSEAEALSMSAGEADLAVANQTNDWRTGAERIASAPASATELVDEQAETLRSPIDATSRNNDSVATSESGEGQVRIVATTGEAASGSGGGSDGEVNQLIEEKASLNRQVDELTYQLDREKEIAANQISVKERQLEVKDQEFAQLQEQMAAMRAELDRLQQNQNQSSAPAADQPWYLSPMFMGGVIGALVLLLAGLLFALRNSRADNEALADALDAGSEADVDTADSLYVEQADDEVEAETDEYADDDSGQVEPTIGQDPVEHEDLLEGDEDFAAQDQEAEPNEDAQTSDVIGEAEIYVAYQRYGQAANLLLGTLASEPDRYDVRLKLLEVFAEAGDGPQFAEHANYIVENCDDEDVLMACRDLEAQMESSQVSLEDDLTDATDSVPDDETSSEQATNDDLDFELDDFDANDDSDDLDLNADATASDANEDSGEFELEFDDENQSGETPDNAGDDLGGDLGLDFDPERDVADETEVSVDSDAELDTDATAEFELDDLEFDEPEADSTDADLEAAESSSTATSDDDFEFDGTADADINATKIDLAEAYIDMGDNDGARDILVEVAEEGTPEQQEAARKMLEDIES